MKKLTKNFKFLIIFAFLALLSLNGFIRKHALSADRQFSRICNSVFIEELSCDSMSLHFAIANPKNYGFSVKESDIRLRSYLHKDRLMANLTLENALLQLNRLNTRSFGAEKRFHYEVIKSSLSGALESEAYAYLAEPFSPTSGIQSEYPLLLAEYAFRTEEDVRNYLILLKHTPSYFALLLKFEQERLQAGYYLSDKNADLVIAACREFASSDTLLTHTFQVKLDKLLANGTLTEEAAHQYLETNGQLVKKYVMKAYQDLEQGILLLKGNGAEEKGLYFKPKGKEYYSFLLRESVGTDKTADELKELLTKKLQTDLTAMQKSIHALTADEVRNYKDPLKTLSPDEILMDLKKRIGKDFPLSDTPSYHYSVMGVDKSLEKHTAPAYYFTPPMDALWENSIYVNHSSTGAGLELYTTLAHEGFPGHLYQAVTTQTSFAEKQLCPLRSILSYGGFVEGYATYAEMFSYSYAKECAKDLTGKKDVFRLYDVFRLDRSSKLCLYSILDIMIHHEGKNLADVTAYLNSFGIKDAAVINNIYDYIVNEPANYLKYYVGYLEILECKQLAEANWGNRYSDASFHTFLMESGPSPFPLLKERIQLLQ